MTASIPALLQPMKDRVTAATPGPWEVADDPLSDGDWMVRQIDYEPDTPDDVAAAIGHESTAEFIAAAPTDQAKLIAAVEAVEALLCGPNDMGVPPNRPNLVPPFYSDLIRGALTQALSGDGA